MKELREETDRLLLPLFEVLDCCCLPSQAMCLPTTQEYSKSQREEGVFYCQEMSRECT